MNWEARQDDDIRTEAAASAAQETEETYEPGPEDADQPAEPERVSFWHRVRRFFFQTAGEKAAEQRQRMADLNRAISDNPQAAANYLLRGELRLERGQYELARHDFMQAIELAEAQFENDQWGLVAQSVMDRARERLRQVKTYLD